MPEVDVLQIIVKSMCVSPSLASLNMVTVLRVGVIVLECIPCTVTPILRVTQPIMFVAFTLSNFNERKVNEKKSMRTVQMNLANRAL